MRKTQTRIIQNFTSQFQNILCKKGGKCSEVFFFIHQEEKDKTKLEKKLTNFLKI